MNTRKNTIAGQWCFRNVGKDKECEHNWLISIIRLTEGIFQPIKDYKS